MRCGQSRPPLPQLGPVPGQRRGRPDGTRTGQHQPDDILKPVVSTVLPLQEARQAHVLSESRHVRGKIVLQVVA
ncbi:MAG: hypothetical protein DCC57_02165 [Chloroflexi bacterium]|nr:MAG: hypothetical protein DCC57_02165 [Chloroflexota bacterium]